MKKVVVWIEQGEYSSWIAKALAGAFVSNLILDCDKLEEECTSKIVSQVLEQDGAFFGLCKSPIALKKEFGGMALLPYGSRTKITMKDVVVHINLSKKDERDLIVKEMLGHMRENKLLKGK